MFDHDAQSMIRMFNRLKALNEEIEEFSTTYLFKAYLESDISSDSNTVSIKDHEQEISEIKKFYQNEIENLMDRIQQSHAKPK